jgi:hypothetical protein
MARLEDLRPNAAVRGILPDAQVTVVTTQWFGSDALQLTYKDPAEVIRHTFRKRRLRTSCRLALIFGPRSASAVIRPW